MRSEIVNLHNKIGATTIYVTHDQTEAMTMATKVVVMSRGFIQQIGTPKEVYNQPKNLFVAKFIGSPTMNFFEASYEKGKIILSNPKIEIAVSESFIARHDACYKNRIKEFKQLFDDFDENSADYIKKIQSALADDKKIITVQRKKSLFTFLKNIGKKAEQKKPFETERAIATEKLEQLEQSLAASHKIILGIRPEKIRIKHITEEEAKKGGIIVQATVCELLGSEYNVHFTLFGKDVIATVGVEEELATGQLFKVELNETDLYAFDPVTGDVI